MGRKPRSTLSSGVYHVLNRGLNRMSEPDPDEPPKTPKNCQITTFKISNHNEISKLKTQRFAQITITTEYAEDTEGNRLVNLFQTR